MIAKKEYDAPAVEKLGTLAQITSATLSAKGASDGGQGQANKT